MSWFDEILYGAFFQLHWVKKQLDYKLILYISDHWKTPEVVSAERVWRM